MLFKSGRSRFSIRRQWLSARGYLPGDDQPGDTGALSSRSQGQRVLSNHHRNSQGVTSNEMTHRLDELTIYE